MIVDNGVPYYIEVANMPTTNDTCFPQGNCRAVAPSKAVNAGGVAVSALEMSQNSMRFHGLQKKLMQTPYHNEKYSQQFCCRCRYGLGYDLVAGAILQALKKLLPQ